MQCGWYNKKSKTFSQSVNGCIKVLLEVYLEKDETLPQAIPSAPISAHNPVQPNPCEQHPHPQSNLVHASMSPLLISPEARASRAQLRLDYERQLDEARVSQAVLGQECARLAKAHETQLARQESLLEQRVEQLVQALVVSLAFGEKQWKQYLGEVGLAPRLPAEIGEILSRPCPFWPNKQVKDTHLLALIPAKVNDKLFSLNLLSELIQHPRGGDRNTKCRYYHQDVRRVLGNRSCDQAYWVLMTRDVLPRSRGMGYRDQGALVAQHTSSTGLPYELPGVLEAATVVLSHYVRGGERLYTDEPWTYTRCQDLISVGGDDRPTIVGGFNTSGLSISYDDFSEDSDVRYGVVGCRRFSRQP